METKRTTKSTEIKEQGFVPREKIFLPKQKSIYEDIQKERPSWRGKGGGSLKSKQKRTGGGWIKPSCKFAL